MLHQLQAALAILIALVIGCTISCKGCCSTMMLLVMQNSREDWLLSTLLHSSLVDKLSPTICHFLHGWRVVS